MALRLARLMEAASVKEAIRATPRNAKSPAAGILVPPERGGWPTKRGRVKWPARDTLFPLSREYNARPSLLSSFLVHPRLASCTRLNRTTIDRPTDTRVERHFNVRAGSVITSDRARPSADSWLGRGCGKRRDARRERKPPRL